MQNEKPWIESEAKQVCQFDQQAVFLKFIKTTIFVFSNKFSKIPKDVINMEGLTAKPIDIVSPAMKLSHRDGIYP